MPVFNLRFGLGGYDQVTINEVIEELERISKRTHTSKGTHAKLALAYAQGLRIIGGKKTHRKGVADEKVLMYAKGKKSVAIASLDKLLLQKARRQGTRTISLSRGRLVGYPIL